MSRKFLFCFPLRLGNIVFGYIVIIFSIALIIFKLYEFLMYFFVGGDSRKNFDYINDSTGIVDFIVSLTYFVIYAVVGLLLFIFATIFTYGAYQLKFKAIEALFIYSFFHIFFTIGLIAWEAVNRDWLTLGLLAVSDVALIASLFGVKYFMDAVKSGRVYQRPKAEIY